jgi:hypothetical protein
MKARSAVSLVVLASAAPLIGMGQESPGQAASIPRFEITPHDPAVLPIGSQGDFSTGIYRCSGDRSVFVTVVTTSAPQQIPTGISLYAVRSATSIIAFHPGLAAGFRTIGPVSRYFVGESRVVALAWGTPLDSAGAGTPLNPRQSVPVLLMFDHEGALLSSRVLDRSLRPEQIGLFPSGEILLLRWDPESKQTVLVVLNDQGSEEREILMTTNDPADRSQPYTALVGVEIYPWRNDLLLVPDNSSRPIVEVSDTGVVNTWTLHVPKGFEISVPVAFDPHRWLFRMDSDEKQEHADTDKPFAQRTRLAEAKPSVVLEFDPSTGDAVRQFAFPAGLQPACEVDGEFLFLGANPDDGKLQFATALIPN